METMTDQLTLPVPAVEAVHLRMVLEGHVGGDVRGAGLRDTRAVAMKRPSARSSGRGR